MSINVHIQTVVNEVGSQVRLATLLGVSPGFVNQLLKNRRPTPPSLCPRIELLSNSKVARKDLRPNDWFEIWPELVE